MKRCLYCQEAIYLRVTWNNVVQLNSPSSLCELCEEKLEWIEGKRCVVCSRESPANCCYDCKRWSEFYNGKDPLIRNYSLFTYNDFMKELITTWKYRGDYVLGTIFQDVFKQQYKKNYSSIMKQAIVLPIPLSEERLLERCFNQAAMLGQFISNDVQTGLSRTFSEKQAKKSRFERITMKNPFKQTERLNKPVVLVDDIYTTGRTLRHAAQLLTENGCPEVYSLTLCRA